MPNPAYYDYDAAVESPAGYARKVLRRGLGFGLVAWFVHPELRKRARASSAATRICGSRRGSSVRRRRRRRGDRPPLGRSVSEATPYAPPSPRRGVPSPPSPSGRPRPGSFDYAISKPPPPAPILLGSPSFVARRAAASPRAPSPRNAPATPTAAARTPAPDAHETGRVPRLRRGRPRQQRRRGPLFVRRSDLRPEHASKLEALETAIRLHVRTTYGHAAARALRADGIYFHRQHALYSEPDRAWTFTAHAHVAIGRARTPACCCHSATLGDVVSRLRAPPSAATPPLELLNVPREPRRGRARRRRRRGLLGVADAVAAGPRVRGLARGRDSRSACVNKGCSVHFLNRRQVAVDVSIAFSVTVPGHASRYFKS